MKNNIWVRVAIVLAIVGSVIALAQNTVVSNQGRPGSQGSWPVSLTTSSTVNVQQGPSRDGGVMWPVETMPTRCFVPTHASTTTGVVAAACPAAQLAGRCTIMFCNSNQNSGAPLVKIRIDGSAPVMAAGNVGDVLAVGQCITYAIPAGVTPQCISDTATTYLTSTECACAGGP